MNERVQCNLPAVSHQYGHTHGQTERREGRRRQQIRIWRGIHGETITQSTRSLSWSNNNSCNGNNNVRTTIQLWFLFIPYTYWSIASEPGSTVGSRCRNRRCCCFCGLCKHSWRREHLYCILWQWIHPQQWMTAGLQELMNEFNFQSEVTSRI